MFLLIDNYDSFTYNLVQAFYALGREPVVLRNDDPSLLSLAARPDLEMVCLSPGPGRPEEAGYGMAFLEKLPRTVPVLGVCLGHQMLGLFGGGEIRIAPVIMHGKQSTISHTGTGLFQGLPNPVRVGRYHSLVVEPGEQSLFTVTARGPQNEVMALQYNDRPWVGVQFHPESVLTPEGMQLLANFPAALEKKEDDQTRFSEILEELAAGRNLSRDMARFGFGKLMDGALTPAQAGSFLMGLRVKGESFVEVAEASRAVLERARCITTVEGPHLDVVGTGGDGRHSFNCSTASSLVLAGLGYRVTKHGNRAVSSTCGSADAIEGLGLPLENSEQEVHEHLKRRGFAFLFAPNFHPAFRHVAPVRRELGIRTIFNILGPLVNPAKPTHILLGVARPGLIPLVTDTLLDLQQPCAAVVCGAGGYDELTPIGETDVSIIRGGRSFTLHVDPQDFGIAPCTVQDLEVHSKVEAIRMLQELLRGQGPSPMLDMIVLNVGLAIYLLEETEDLSACMTRARDAVRAGTGMKVLHA